MPDEESELSAAFKRFDAQTRALNEEREKQRQKELTEAAERRRAFADRVGKATDEFLRAMKAHGYPGVEQWNAPEKKRFKRFRSIRGWTVGSEIDEYGGDVGPGFQSSWSYWRVRIDGCWQIRGGGDRWIDPRTVDAGDLPSDSWPDKLIPMLAETLVKHGVTPEQR